MANAIRDDNRVTGILGVSSADLSTPTRVSVNPITGAMLIDGTSLYSSLDTRYLVKAGITGGQTAIGGTAVTDILKLQGTSGNGTLTSPAVQILVGNNGATIGLTVLNNGNVGIGTTSPDQKLVVNGYIKSTGFTYGVLLLEDTNTGAGGTTWSLFSGAPTHGDFKIRGKNADPFKITGTVSDNSLVINSGNVGIGTTSPDRKFHTEVSDTTTNAVIYAQRLTHICSTASTGLANGGGIGIEFELETATDTTNQIAATIESAWVDATNATRKGNLSLYAYDTAARLGMQIAASGSVAMLGFYGTAPIIQQAFIAYTADNESGAYTGIDNAQAGSVYAQLTDLNALRVAYENLRVAYEDIKTKLVATTLVTTA